MRENGFRALGGLAQRLTSGLAEKRSKGRGASIARLDGSVVWVTFEEYDQELKDGPSKLFYCPYTTKGGWTTARSVQTK